VIAISGSEASVASASSVGPGTILVLTGKGRKSTMSKRDKSRRTPSAVPTGPRPVEPDRGGPAPFLSDIQTLRERARRHMQEGAVTENYRADRATVVRLLNEALATEIVCVLRYKRHYFMASGIHAQAVADEFLEHANEEQQHADQIAQRITQLNGE